MLRAIVRFCIDEPWLASLLGVALCAAGWLSYRSLPIDAIPNVGENQVIVVTEWSGRSPKDVEDQITYPLSVALLAVPGAESVRGQSMFGNSFVQVTFADDVDFYWARSRVAEQLGAASAKLPDGVTPQLGPDATALGQIYYYVLEPPAEGMSLAELRTLQDYVIRYELQAVPGVSEVASIGGYVRQYQIDVDPDKLRYHQISLARLSRAIRESNLDVGAKAVEAGGLEYLVRSKGFLGAGEGAGRVMRDIETIVIEERAGVPVRVSDVAHVQLGPAFRRGALDHDGSEVVGGVVVMRYGENPRAVLDRVKAKIAQIEPALQGVRIRGVYDRTELIDETVATLTGALEHEILITAAVILLFLLHLRSSLVVAICLPAAVLMAFIAMRIFHVDANIMSLAGIAIAIGTIVDMSIIVCENIYDALADQPSDAADPGARRDLIHGAAMEVVPAVVTAVATTIVSFLPVFFLTGRDYKLFAPLAYTKTFAIAAAMIVAVTLVPALCRLLLHRGRVKSRSALVISLAAGVLLAICSQTLWGSRLAESLGISLGLVNVLSLLAGLALGWLVSVERIRPIEEIPTSRLIRWLYAARLRFALDHKWIALSFPGLLLVVAAGAWMGVPQLLAPLERVARTLGAEPNDLPGYVDLKHTWTGLTSDDWIALDEGSWFYMPQLYPGANFSQAMQVLQTQDVRIKQIPEVKEVLGKIGRVESALDPAPAAMVETYVMLHPPDRWRPGMTSRDIWDEINRAGTLPGVPLASPLQPIEGRIVMLQSGIKASMAVRIYGDELEQLATAALDVAGLLKKSPYVKAGTIAPDIVLGKPYLEFTVDREAAARYAMTVEMVNEVIETALGGKLLLSTVEGRERYPVQLRYARDLRENLQQLDRLPVVTHDGATVPLNELADLELTWGPGKIRSENSRLVAHVAFSPNGAAGDLQTAAAVEQFLREAQSLRGDRPDRLELPAGYSLEIVGSFENQVEANRRLAWIVPLVVLINLLLIYFGFRNIPISLAVFTGIPVAFSGGVIAVAVADVELNTAVWVGFIALFGLAVDDGVVMATYIHQRLRKATPSTPEQVRTEIYQAGLKRIRPCMMTTVTTLVALLPIIVSSGRGADVARAMALPVFGGMLAEPFTSFIVPTLYSAYAEWKLRAERWGLFSREAEVASHPLQLEVEK
jgi:Cu(I)/Ag(I) efflux system membrane protein CusA/SilA